MTNIKRILVPTDFSETARTAYEYAIRLAEQFKASIDVVHIYRPITADIASLYPSKETRLVWEKQLQDFVTQSIEKQDIKGDIVLRRVHVNAELISGFVGETIVELSKKDYDLVVVGSTGGGVFSEIVFDSVTTDVAQNAYCPVLVVPPNSTFTKVKRLVYACDFKHKSFKHPALIADVAEFFKAKIDILYVENYDENRDNDATDMSDMVAVFNMQTPLLKVTAHVVEEGDVFYGINEFAKKYKSDLVVMITKHHTTWEKWFRGSVTKELAMYSDLPLLVLKSDS